MDNNIAYPVLSLYILAISTENQAIVRVRRRFIFIVRLQFVRGFMIVTNPSLFALKLFAALGCGLVAGVFFAFSTFVMSALAQRPPAQGIAAMQAINITVINPLFMTALFGTAAACIFLAIASLLKWHQPGAAYLLLGSLLYLIGTVGVTIAFNVPLNDALLLLSQIAPKAQTSGLATLLTGRAGTMFGR